MSEQRFFPHSCPTGAIQSPADLLGHPSPSLHVASLGVALTLAAVTSSTLLLSAQHPPSSPNPALLEISGKTDARAGANLQFSLQEAICTLAPQFC